MNILAIDISGKVDKYDEALYRCISQQVSASDAFSFACPYFSIQKNARPLQLYSLVPPKYRNTFQLWKRMLKVIEGILNYLLVMHYIKREKIDVLHLQWLPFLEVCLWEKYWLRTIRKQNPNLKIILTIHNIYPHNSSVDKKNAYKKRMVEIIPLIDQFIVHNNTSKNAIVEEFNIQIDKIVIIHHGIFVPTHLPTRNRKDDKTRILLFGSQSEYKGTDILIKAIELLPADIQSKIEVHITGATDIRLYQQYKELAKALHIVWNNQFIPDDLLYRELQDADLIVYPYRAIAQSGALLLGLYFKKPIIVSDLPSFKETLGPDYPTELICKSCDAQSLAGTIAWHINNPSQLRYIQEYIQQIIDRNSWKVAAQKTIELYNPYTQER